MTTYYLLLEGDTEEDSFYETNVLGEESLGTFYPGQGFIAFNNIVNKHPQVLDSVTILIRNYQNSLLIMGRQEVENFQLESWLIVQSLYKEI